MAQVLHSIALEVELNVQTSQPVPQLAHCPEVAPNWNPVLQLLQVIAPVLDDLVHCLQLDTPQESHVTLVLDFGP